MNEIVYLIFRQVRAPMLALLAAYSVAILGMIRRITTSIVFAGAIAKQILKEEGILIGAHIKSLKDIEDRNFKEEDITEENIDKLRNIVLPVLSQEISEKMEKAILKAREESNSLGGIVEIMVTGLKPGIGDPFFESIESELSRMIFSIPATKGIEFGAGFGITRMTGYEANDRVTGCGTRPN